MRIEAPSIHVSLLATLRLPGVLIRTTGSPVFCTFNVYGVSVFPFFTTRVTGAEASTSVTPLTSSVPSAKTVSPKIVKFRTMEEKSVAVGRVTVKVRVSLSSTAVWPSTFRKLISPGTPGMSSERPQAARHISAVAANTVRKADLNVIIRRCA